MSDNQQQKQQQEVKIVTLEEVRKHSNRDSVWFVINNKVYDVTKFMDDHPGGEEVLLEQAGKDATEIFVDVSHSSDAVEMMKTYYVGDVPEHERKEELLKSINDIKKRELKNSNMYESDTPWSLTWAQWCVTIVVSTCVGLFVRSMLNGS